MPSIDLAPTPTRRTPVDVGGAVVPQKETLFERLKVTLLTRDPRQQLRLAQSGLANLLMVGCIAIASVLDLGGIADHAWLIPWIWCTVGGMLTVFAVIRSGRVTHWKDPSLTMPQMFYAVLSAAAGYFVLGSERALAIPILAVVLMFGSFGMDVREVRIIGAHTTACFAIVCGVIAFRNPSGSVCATQVAHFMMVIIVMSGVIAIVGRLHTLRRGSREQRAALSAALQRIGELATRDPLTGCFNRRAMVDRLAEESERDEPNPQPLGIALFDLDHFKSVNDRHGHAIGDTVLCRFAEIAASSLRATDVLSRWGGEEFVLLLAQTASGTAESCVQRVIDRFAAERFASPSGEFSVTCSAGLIEQRPGEDLVTAVDRADGAMYRAKDRGRNRIVVA